MSNQKETSGVISNTVTKSLNMNFIQTLRRLRQKTTAWDNIFKTQANHLVIAEKLYKKHGLELKLTCGACPEQYEVFKDGKQVAYYRLRHGEFSIDYPTVMGETIFEDEPMGDGCFTDNERLYYLSKSMKIVLDKISNP